LIVYYIIIYIILNIKEGRSSILWKLQTPWRIRSSSKLEYRDMVGQWTWVRLL